jgi:hypothetical protein
MIPNLNSLIDRLSSAFRIEQRIDTERMLLITESYLGTKLLYTHDMPLEPLYELLKDRILKEITDNTVTPPSEK